MQLEGQVAIVTGAGTGLGKTIAEVFAREGAKVATIGRRLEKLKETEASVKALGGGFLAVQGDIARYEDCQRVVAQTVETWGAVNILVNNAGRHTNPAITHEVTVEDFDAFMGINLRGPFMLIKESLPHMLRQGGGRIVNISSFVGLKGVKYCLPYATTKAGMANMTRTIALEYADKGIMVNCVAPGGMFPTENTNAMSPEQREMMQEAIPRPPTGNPSSTEDIAQLVLYLVGPYGGNVTGAVIAADGGHMAR